MALVTGASRGIGRGLVPALAARGYDVVGVSRGLVEVSGLVEHHAVDVSDEQSVRSLVSGIVERHGRLDAVVHAAAIASAELAASASSATVDGVFRTNVGGTANVCREAVRAMLPRRYGRIILFSSVLVSLGLPGTAAYSSSKAAIEQWARVLAGEVAPYGITVNVVAPSLVETDMAAALSRDARARILERLTIKRAGTLDDVAHATLFFLDPASSYLTGQVLSLGLVS